MSRTLDPRIDAYIKNAAPFAQPVLKHLRELVHKGCPEASETIKWSSPFFEHAGRILCFMAAFKAHCAFGFWHRGMKKVVAELGARSDAAMGSLGRITSRADLPDDETMVGLVRAAARLNESGSPARRPTSNEARKAIVVPADLTAALKRNAAARKTFAAFSPSKRRDYVEWIVEAKREETRRQRLATTLEWLAEGKPRNWKYLNR